MNKTDRENIVRRICEGNCILFAGAGLGQQCGLPGWENALGELADIVEPDDAIVAAAMRDRIDEGLLLDAADFFAMSKLTPQSKLEALIKIFDRDVTADARVRELIELPFHAFVTTNFDNTIEETIAAIAGEAVTHFRNSQQDLKSALFYKKRYVAHLHGDMQVPESVVLGPAGLCNIKSDGGVQQLPTSHFSGLHCPLRRLLFS